MTGASVLVLGGGGMLGHKMFQRLQRDYPDVRCTIRAPTSDPWLSRISLLQDSRTIDSTDVDDTKAFHCLLRELKPDVMINCIGIVKQRDEAKSFVPSIRINALLPHELAEVCAEWGGRLITFSTDCVFSGRRGMYSEADSSDAEDLYGRTKYLGEVTAPNALTLRTSMIGRELTGHRSLLGWFLAQNGKRVSGYTHALYSGVTTIHLANVVADLIERDMPINGLYQLASEPISKYDLLTLIRDTYRLDVEVTPDDTFACDRTMSGALFDAATGHRCPSWPALVAELAADPTPYDEWLSDETV